MFLELENVIKTYQSGSICLEILSGISLQLNEGDSAAITGRSGSGKSTLLNLVAGLDKPTGGTIKVGGDCISHLSEEKLTAYRQHTIGLVFQLHYLLKDFSAIENIMLPGLMAGTPKAQVRQKAEELLVQVDMADRKDHYPSQLSGGECQRIALARSLVNNPKIILADEPTGSLDENNALIIEDILFDLVEKYRKSLIYVTHNERFSQRGGLHFLLEGGRLHS